MRRTAFLIVGLLSIWPGAARPAPPTAEAAVDQALHLNTTRDLFTLCSVQPGQPLYERAIAFCIGYVTGVMQYHTAIAKGPRMRPLICPGRELARFEVVRQFLDWAPAHPQYMDAPPVEGLARSAVAEWPCPRT